MSDIKPLNAITSKLTYNGEVIVAQCCWPSAVLIRDQIVCARGLAMDIVLCFLARRLLSVPLHSRVYM